jgi:sugar phosphate isomerase/epimerase
MYACFNARASGLDLTAETTLELAAAAGFTGVDLMVRDLVDSGADPRVVRARMDDLGLRGGAWPLPVAWRGEAEPFVRDLERLPRNAEAAVVLGLTRTGTWVMPETPGRPAPGETSATYLERVERLHVERLGAIARVLDGQGVQFGLEVIGVESSRNGAGLPFITRLADLGGLLERVSAEAPNVGPLIDSFHLYAAGEEVDAALAWGGQRVVWVHLADLPSTAGTERREMKEEDRGLPGEHGSIANLELLEKLARSGYDGPVIAEPMVGWLRRSGLDPREVAYHVAAALRSVWPDRAAAT